MFEKQANYSDGNQESKRRIRNMIIGSAVFNVILIAGMIKTNEDAEEINRATSAINSFLATDGYEDVRDLAINYRDNTFTFEISDTEHLLVCAGSYDYEKRKVMHLGGVVCAPLNPVVPAEPIRSV